MGIPQVEGAKVIRAGETLMYYMFGLVVQTFFFGAYTILIWLSTRMLLNRGLKTRVNQIMFGITVFMYLLSVAYWAYSVADGADRMYQYIGLAINPSKTLPDHTLVTQWSPLFNAITLINYVLSDGVVIWRAWVICLRNHRKYLWITIVLLGVTAIAVLLTIAIRIAGLVESPIVNLSDGNTLRQIIDIAQITTLISSMLSNLTATGVVSATAWRHWRTIRSTFTDKSSTRSNHILLLVVETGVIYCFSAIAVLLSSLIRLPQGTLGDLYTPCQVQIAGAYPSIVLLLVSTQRSLNDSSFTDDATFTGSTASGQGKPGPSPNRSQNAISINFARNPAMSGTGTMDSSFRDIPLSGKGRSRRLSDESFA
ncbi:hypothetical protein B0H17DRAFT_1059933 [Mycena rosella]|uniref:Uncharacterized protein n=1 Tax=Mycena rosella TaxID=1033263 RepID=A0AAD7GGD2_MYCRO|nr:hypothetical protein B0H17DRAFT_1059933 [Mycena rosella]